MKIGFIAMSGVRACDAELMRIGMTLPGFVERSEVIASLPSLGLLTLAGMTPKRHEVSYHEVADVNTQTDWPSFDLVAISTFTAQALDAYAIADRYRAAGTKVVIGGLHATAMPLEAAAHADAVVVGEGELCWPDVLADAERGTLAQFYRSRPREFDLADAPMPAFELLDISKYNRLTVQTTRGCPWRCEFCASSILLTNHYKQKPMEKVLAEVDRIRELWPRPFIEFADDNSFVNRRFWKALLPELALRRVRWFTETDISVAEDTELLALMRQAGCVEVLIGLESPESAGLDGLELRRDWKLSKLPRYRSAVHTIQSHGIRVNGCFILGLDGQGPEIFDRVYDFARELELYDVQITLQTPFPGTPLYERLKREGRLLQERPWGRSTLFDLNFVPRPMSAEELVGGMRSLAARLYGAECTAWRREVWKRKYARGHRARRLTSNMASGAGRV
jgi:radical SAM superfamily enzyme YgiQ (UPF0313 family)